MYPRPNRQLHVFSTVTGERRALVKPISFYDEDQLPREERLRRERLRERGLGVTSYSWAEHADTLMVPFPDGVYVQHGLAGELQKVVDSSGNSWQRKQKAAVPWRFMRAPMRKTPIKAPLYIAVPHQLRSLVHVVR